MISFEGQKFEPAQIESGTNVYKNPNFILAKRRWQPDNEAQFCPICNCKFGGLKRRHHCRQCGLVVCNKCCQEKIALPQLAIEEQERVCDVCLPVAKLVTKSRSTDQATMTNAAKELAAMCADVQHIPQLFGVGGYHTLLALGSKKTIKIIENVLAGLHTLSTYEQLHEMMVRAGHIAVLCEILSQEELWVDQILLDGISALMIFCKTEKYKLKVLQAGFLHVALKLCLSPSDTVALLSVNTLSKLLTHFETHESIIDGQRQALKRLLDLTVSENDQMQAGTLKCLNYLSLSSDWNRHRIVQEDFTAGRLIKSAIQQKTDNMQVLANAVCLIANLAINADDQKTLADSRDSLLDLFSSDVSNQDVLEHATRGIANFCKFQYNYQKMITKLPMIVYKAVSHNKPAIVRHGLRAILNLLSQQPQETAQELVKNGAEQVLQQLGSNHEVMAAISPVLLQQEPCLANPL